jgi:hypothetical protein
MNFPSKTGSKSHVVTVTTTRPSGATSSRDRSVWATIASRALDPRDESASARKFDVSRPCWQRAS